MTEQSNQTPPSTQSDGPRIYVACLAAYNNGHLHGEWINADQDADDIHAAISAMLKKSPIPHAEEFVIHDYEGFEGADIQEYTDIETLVKLAHSLANMENLAANCCLISTAILRMPKQPMSIMQANTKALPISRRK